MAALEPKDRPLKKKVKEIIENCQPDGLVLDREVYINFTGETDASSQNSSHYILKKHLIPYFGQMPMDLISESIVQEWISGLKLQGKLEPKTIGNMWKVLKLIIGKPTREWTIRPPEVPETEQRFFTPKEMEQLIDAAEGQYKALFALQFATGMRFKEIAGLHVEDLDFSELVVYISW